MTHLKNYMSISFFLVLILSLLACGDDVELDLSELLEGEAVEVIESALQSRTGGLITNVEDITTQLNNAIASGEACDTLYTKTDTDTYEGTQIESSYSSTLSYEMTCNNFDFPMSATFSSSTESSYTTSRIVSDDNGEFTGDITELLPNSLNIVLGGNYNKTGTQELDFTDQLNLNSTMDFDLVDLEVAKISKKIQSGTGTFTFTGSTQDASFSYVGDIIFNGNGDATLTINGTTYEIDIE